MKKLIPTSFKNNHLKNVLQQSLTASVVFLSRLKLPIKFLPANISPLGGWGFFGNSWWYFLSIVTFDIFIGGLYPNFWVTYLAFSAYPIMGKLAAKKLSLKFVLLPVASFLFFLISNFGVWWYWYPQTLEGLATCYTLALPFYSRTLIGDLIFGYGYMILKLLLKERSFLKKLKPSYT